MSRYYWSAGITSSHLQSLVQIVFDAFYYVSSAIDHYDLHTPDEPGGIHAGIDALDAAYATLADSQGSFYGRLCCYYIASFSRLVYLLAGIPFCNNSVVSS